MEPKQTLTCPLCEGEGQVRASNLSDVLQNKHLRDRLEKYAAELLSVQNEAAGVGVSSEPDFQKEVHSWNPQLSIWRRSPKE
jgi:hypothetical protein